MNGSRKMESAECPLGLTRRQLGGLDQHDLNMEDKSLIGIGKWDSGNYDLEQLL